jgi:hypothetical protein
MGTSRSPDDDRWVARAMLYSGRRDPTWAVPAELGLQLEQVWKRLPPWSGELPEPPPLGYRGCTLMSGDGRLWTAFKELVTQAAEGRCDPSREFERSLIASAPDGVVPPFAL